MKISERLKIALEEKDMKPVDLSEITGISKSSISEWLKDKYQPKQDNIFLIAEALNVSPAWLMGKDVPMLPTEDDEIAQLMEELHKNPDLRILMSTSSKVTAESLRVLINLAQNMKERDD